MAKVSEIYSGAYLSGVELAGKSYNLQIADVAIEEVGQERERKLVVSFRGAQKALVLNKGNASTLAGSYGDDTTAWVGRWCEIFTMATQFAGRTYDGIKVRPIDGPQQAATAPAAPATQPAPVQAAPAEPAQPPAAPQFDPAEFVPDASGIPF